MTILTAYTQFDSRTITAFSSAVTDLVIDRDSEIVLVDATDAAIEAAFHGKFKLPASGTSYGKAKDVSFYSSDVLHYNIAGAFSLAADSEGNITFPDASGFSALGLFKGNDRYFGSTSDDYFSIYDNRGKDIYSGLDGDDYLELGVQGGCVAGGGAGNDLLVCAASNNKLTGGAGNDFFWLGTYKAAITDFSATDDRIVLQKSYYEDKMLKDWLSGDAADFPVAFTADADGNYLIPTSNILCVEGIKSAKVLADEDDYFIYDLGTGRLYFDVDGVGGKAATVLTTLENKPVLTEAEIAASLIFADHLENYRSDWLANYFS